MEIADTRSKDQGRMRAMIDLLISDNALKISYSYHYCVWVMANEYGVIDGLLNCNVDVLKVSELLIRISGFADPVIRRERGFFRKLW